MAKTRESIMAEQLPDNYDTDNFISQDTKTQGKVNGNGNNGYGAQNIQILEGLEAVRVRPGMYIGSTDQRGLHHLITEVVDNSVDEFMAGEATTVSIVIHEDSSVTVSDDGRGIPV